MVNVADLVHSSIGGNDRYAIEFRVNLRECGNVIRVLPAGIILEIVVSLFQDRLISLLAWCDRAFVLSNRPAANREHEDGETNKGTRSIAQIIHSFPL